MKPYKILYFVPIIAGICGIILMIIPSSIASFLPLWDGYDLLTQYCGLLALVGGPICYLIARHRNETDVRGLYIAWPIVMFIYWELLTYNLGHLFRT